MHYSLRIALLVSALGTAPIACGGELRRSSCADNEMLHDGDCMPIEQAGGKGGSGGAGAASGSGATAAEAGGDLAAGGAASAEGGAAGAEGGALGSAGTGGEATTNDGGMAGVGIAGAENAGAAGSGEAGSPNAPPACPHPTPPVGSVIDDFEQGLAPGWYELHDTSGAVAGPSFLSVSGGAPSSKGGLTFTGRGFNVGPDNYGAIVGQLAQCTDVSGQHGLSFWAKSSKLTLRLSVGTPRSLPVDQGGECPADQACADYPSALFHITTTWSKYSATWAQLKQLDGGYPDDFEKRFVSNWVEFWVYSSPEVAVGDFELDLDDVTYF